MNLDAVALIWRPCNVRLPFVMLLNFIKQNVL